MFDPMIPPHCTIILYNAAETERDPTLFELAETHATFMA
jgi:hypothetical protein